jgi:thioredoxin 1
MATEATVETYQELVSEGAVLVDFWGPRCAPCLALMPAVEQLEERFAGRFRVVKVDASQNRQICRDLKVFGLPTFVLYRDGDEVRRLTGNPTAAEIKAAVAELVEGGD